MKVNLSLLSKVRSFAGIEVGYGGYLKRNEHNNPILVRTIEFSIGFIFGWLCISFDNGHEINLDDINASLRAEVMKGKTIDTNE